MEVVVVEPDISSYIASDAVVEPVPPFAIETGVVIDEPLPPVGNALPFNKSLLVTKLIC